MPGPRAPLPGPDAPTSRSSTPTAAGTPTAAEAPTLAGDLAAGGAPAPAAHPRPGDPRPRGVSLLASAGVGVLAAGLASLAALPHQRSGLLAVVVVIQLGLTFGWLRAVAVPRPLPLWGVCMATGLAADLLLTLRGGVRLGPLAGVLGLGLVAALLLELGWSGRHQVSDVLAAAAGGGALAIALAALLALHEAADGAALTAVAMAATAVALAGARLPGRLAGLAVADGAGVGLATALGAGLGAVSFPGGGRGALLGLAVGVSASVAARALDRLAALAGQRSWLLVTALAPLSAAAGAAYLLGRVLAR